MQLPILRPWKTRVVVAGSLTEQDFYICWALLQIGGWQDNTFEAMMRLQASFAENCTAE